MGKSKSYRGAPGWEGQNDNKGKESQYSSAPAAKYEGTVESGGGDFSKARRGTSAGKGKSTTRRAPTSKGFGQY
jgi:hypothetical protein